MQSLYQINKIWLVSVSTATSLSGDILVTKPASCGYVSFHLNDVDSRARPTTSCLVHNSDDAFLSSFLNLPSSFFLPINLHTLRRHQIPGALLFPILFRFHFFFSSYLLSARNQTAVKQGGEPSHYSTCQLALLFLILTHHFIVLTTLTTTTLP